MRRSSWLGLAAAVTGILGVTGWSVTQLTRNLEHARKASRERMAGLAEYVEEQLRQDWLGYSFTLDPASLPEDLQREKSAWLSRLARASGLRRMALTDSLGVIYISSQPGLAWGQPVTELVGDAGAFESALRRSEPTFSAGAAGGRGGQALYVPFDLHGVPHLLVLEEDATFLEQFEQYRRFMLGLSALVPLLLAALAGYIVLLDRRAREAAEEARRLERLAFLGRTSAELAHELKNPLAVIKSAVDVLRRKHDPEGKEKPFRFLSEEVMRLSRIINNILGFSRSQPLEGKAFPISGAAGFAAERVAAESPGMKIEDRLPAGAWVHGDPEAARQVLENLMRNAAQAAGGRGRVLLEAEEGRAGWEIRVADDGPGLPEHLTGSVFDPFVTTKNAGTGLGLAIVKTLCERMGWQIEWMQPLRRAAAYPEMRTGSCFVISAPKAVAAPETQTPAQEVDHVPSADRRG